MSIENITKKILSEQTEATNAVIESAKKQCDEIIEQAKAKAAENIELSAQKAATDALLLKEKKASAAKLDSQKMYLEARQQAIGKAFDTALANLVNMDENSYIDFIVKKINQTSVLDGELLLTEKDRDQIGNKIIDAVNSSGKNGKMILSNKTISGKGGFVLRQGPVDINATLEAIINEAKDTMTPTIVKALFE